MSSFLKLTLSTGLLCISTTVSALQPAPYVPDSVFQFSRYLTDVQISSDIVHCARLAIVERDPDASQHLRHMARGFEHHEYYKTVSDNAALQFDPSGSNLTSNICQNSSIETFKAQERMDASDERVKAVKMIANSVSGCDTVNALYRSGSRQYLQVDNGSGGTTTASFNGWQASILDSVLQGKYDSLSCSNPIVIRHHRVTNPFASQHGCPKCDTNGDGFNTYSECWP